MRLPMIRTFIQFASLFLTVGSAFFLAKGSLGLSVKAIAELATQKWDYNLDLINNLAQQQADTWTGFVLLLAALLLQIANALWPMRLEDFDIHRGAVVYALALSIVIFFGAFYVTKERARNTAADVVAIIERQMSIGPSGQPNDSETAPESDPESPQNR